MNTKLFQKIIWDFYKENRRGFPWRETVDPYKILISEVMLQQTQTYRVLPKYKEWIKEFPDLQTLAKARLNKILRVWSGLGYNRRALYLHEIAKLLCSDVSIHENISNPSFLQTLPGIGKNTSAAIAVFSKNKPQVFIETNIRRVFIHFFFKDKQNIPDKDILALVEKSIDLKNPREWYYALMDYGNYLGKVQTNPNRKSRHYTKQSKFEGSLRQTRGQILKILLQQKSISISSLRKQINKNHVAAALSQLEKEGFLKLTGGILTIKQ